jgi:hypothetical protein
MDSGNSPQTQSTIQPALTASRSALLCSQRRLLGGRQHHDAGGSLVVLETTGSAARLGITGAAIGIGRVLSAVLGGPWWIEWASRDALEILDDTTLLDSDGRFRIEKVHAAIGRRVACQRDGTTWLSQRTPRHST